MFDFSEYQLNELTAIDNFVCYTRAMAAEHIDLPQIRKELMQLHRSLSRAINTRLDEAAEEWDAAHKNTKAYKAVVSEPVAPVMAQQAEQVDRIVQACIADAPPAEDPEPVPDMFGLVGDALDDLCAAGEVLGSNE